jgi:3-chloro-4-hydroxyphenylacetate reductive dehalogenase
MLKDNIVGLTNKKPKYGPYPVEKLKRVAQPTTKLTDSISQVSERDSGFIRAALGQFGPLAKKEISRFIPKEPIGAAESFMVDHLRTIADGEVTIKKAQIPDNPAILSQNIKRLAYFLCADIVGICELPQYAVYSHNARGKPIENHHKYAIVVVTDQDYTTMHGSTGRDWISGAQSFRGYSNNGFITTIMAEYIRSLGYPARAHFHTSYQVLIPPLLLLSGIGEMSRSGCILNPFLGLRFKAGAITTDLPLLPDKPIDFGLQDFCNKCKKCALACPAKAISADDKIMYNGYETWKFDAELCTKFRVTNQKGASCGRCIKVCPWNKSQGPIHNAVRWMIKNAPLTNSFIIWMDNVIGYSKPDQRDRWWFDLENVDGSYQKPRK